MDMQSQANVVARFEQLIERVTIAGCWLWTAAVDRDGYAKFKVAGRNVRAHRWAYEVAYGTIPAGLHLDHKCRVRCCVNPAHLEPVTARVNTLRGYGPAAINAVKTHCAYGHPLTEGTFYRRSDSRERLCKTCVSARNAAAYQKRKGRQS